MLIRRRFFNSLSKLHASLQVVKANPYHELELLLSIQENLIRRIKYIESRVRNSKKTGNYEQATEYQYILRCFKTIGDGLAFIYISRWDVKIFARNNSPGFISGKTGFIEELKVLRYTAKITPVILADLTNCLRHGDIYIFREHFDPLIIELKSSKSGGGREQRQKNRLANIIDYLSSDVSINKVKKGELLYRQPTKYVEKNHSKPINQAISVAFKRGYETIIPEEGLIYILECEDNVERVKDAMDIYDNHEAWLLNDLLTTTKDFFPLSLNLDTTKAFTNLIDYSVIIIVVLDIDYIINRLNNYGIKVLIIKNDQWLFELENKNEVTMKVSRGFFGRIAYEFLSLDWMIKELIEQLNQLPKDLNLLE